MTEVRRLQADGLLFAGADGGGRLRRPVDALLVVAAAVLFVIASVLADAVEQDEPGVVEAAGTLLGWFGTGWRIAYAALMGFGLIVVVAIVWTRRWRLGRDAAAAVATVVVIAIPVGRAVRSDWPTLTGSLWGASDQYPAVRLAAVVALLTVAGPELTRTARLSAIWLALLGGVGAVALGIGYPSSVLGAIALALAVGGLIRLAFGTSRGFPSTDRVRAGLDELGISVGSLRVATRQRPGSATFTALDPDRTPLQVVVLGRDAQDTQRLANTWRNLAYREAAPDLATGRLHQVEHEALITLLAERAGVPAPNPRAVGVVDSGDSLLVTVQPDAPAAEVADELTDEFLGQLWRQASALRAARLTHGALNLSNVLVTDDGPMIVRFERGRVGAAPSALNIDLAELLVSSSVAVGPDRAVAFALEAAGPDAVADTLPYLQRAALTPHLRDLARGHEVKLEKLRRQAAAATGVDVPEIEPLHRVRIRDVLTMALVAVAAYVIITQLARIGIDTLYDQLRQAEWAWVILGLMLAQLTFVTDAVALRGAVVSPLPLAPCIALESALKFINLTVPSDAGRIAVNVRFLQRQGVPTGGALAAGAVDAVAQTLVQVVLLLLILPFIDLNVDMSGADSSRLLWIFALLVVAAVIVIVAVVAVPKLRDKVFPTVKTAWGSLVTVARTRSKRVQLFAGNIGTQVLFALTLGAACHAYGFDLSLAELMAVNMGASVFATVVPVPGGIGVAEAGLSAGLVAVGVDQSTAFAIALTHRLCTYYVPPLWGYFALRWLNRKAFL
jgi:glycosyltransferase 2 family protein